MRRGRVIGTGNKVEVADYEGGKGGKREEGGYDFEVSGEVASGDEVKIEDLKARVRRVAASVAAKLEHTGGREISEAT